MSPRQPPARGARLRLVSRKRPPSPVPPAFPQAQGGTLKQKLLFELVRARVAVHAAIQGLVPGSAEEIVDPERGSVRQQVLDLIAADRAASRSIESALLGRSVSAASEPDAAGALTRLEWSEALRRLYAGRDQLMEALESVPEDPATPWQAGHPFADLLAQTVAADRAHAEAIKRWRTTRESPPPG